jgi:hypothetical protein
MDFSYSLLIIIVFIFPGLVFHRLKERWSSRPDDTSLIEYSKAIGISFALQLCSLFLILVIRKLFPHLSHSLKKIASNNIDRLFHLVERRNLDFLNTHNSNLILIVLSAYLFAFILAIILDSFCFWYTNPLFTKKGSLEGAVKNIGYERAGCEPKLYRFLHLLFSFSLKKSRNSLTNFRTEFISKKNWREKTRLLIRKIFLAPPEVSDNVALARVGFNSGEVVLGAVFFYGNSEYLKDRNLLLQPIPDLYLDVLPESWVSQLKEKSKVKPSLAFQRMAINWNSVEFVQTIFVPHPPEGIQQHLNPLGATSEVNNFYGRLADRESREAA